MSNSSNQHSLFLLSTKVSHLAFQPPNSIRVNCIVLGSEYCSGYADVFGKWNTGFYCPQETSTSAVFCCGRSDHKYCCIARPTLDYVDESEAAMLPYTVRIPVFFAIFCGILAVVFLLITAVCFFCSCCFVYKKRRDEASTGLYRIQGSSSTASALASIYSNHNSSVVTTPLDTDWTSQLPSASYIPYPFSQQSTPQLSSSLASYPSPAIISALQSTNTNQNNNTNNSNNPPAFYYNNLSPHAFTNNNNNHMNGNSCTSNFSSLSSLFHQAQYHQTYQRPLSAQSTLSTYSSNSTLTLPGLPIPLQQAQHQRSLNPGGYNNLPRNQGYVHRPQAQTALPHSTNSFINPFCFPNAPGTNGTPSRFNQSFQAGRPARPFQQQQNGYQSQTLPYNNSNNNGTSTARPTRTPGNQSNQQQQERLATIQSLINAYRASVNSATAAVMRSNPGSFNNNDISRLNELNSLFSAVLNQNRRPGNYSGGGGGGPVSRGGANANGVIRTSGESKPATTTATRNGNNINTNTLQGNDGVISNRESVRSPPDPSLKGTNSALGSKDANENSDDGGVTSVPLSTGEEDGANAKENEVVVRPGPNPNEPEGPDTATPPVVSIAEGETEAVKSVSDPVLPESSPLKCVEIPGVDDVGGNQGANEGTEAEKNYHYDNDPLNRIEGDGAIKSPESEISIKNTGDAVEA